MSSRFGVACLILLAADPLAAQAGSPLVAPLREAQAVWVLDGEKEGFTHIDSWWVKISSAGHPVVLDGHDLQFRFYATPGKAPALAGRRGGGPGEFGTNMLSIGWLADSIWVYDPSARRMTWFSGAGKLLRDAAFPPPEGTDPRSSASLFFSRPLAVLPDRSVLFAATTRGENRQNVFAIASPAGKVSRTVASYVMLRPTLQIPAVAPTGEQGTRTFMMSPMDPNGSDGAVASDGSWVLTKRTTVTGITVQMHLIATRANGATLWDRTFTFRGEVRPDSSRTVSTEMSADPAVRRKLQDAISTVWAPVEYLVAGRDNVTWLQWRRTPAGTPLVMLDAKGTPVARIVVPGEKVIVVHGSRDTVWVIAEDHDGIPSVIQYSVKG